MRPCTPWDQRCFLPLSSPIQPPCDSPLYTQSLPPHSGFFLNDLTSLRSPPHCPSALPLTSSPCVNKPWQWIKAQEWSVSGNQNSPAVKVGQRSFSLHITDMGCGWDPTKAQTRVSCQSVPLTCHLVQGESPRWVPGSLYNSGQVPFLAGSQFPHGSSADFNLEPLDQPQGSPQDFLQTVSDFSVWAAMTLAG